MMTIHVKPNELVGPAQITRTVMTALRAAEDGVTLKLDQHSHFYDNQDEWFTFLLSLIDVINNNRKQGEFLRFIIDTKLCKHELEVHLRSIE